MSKNNKKNFLEVGELYRWSPIGELGKNFEAYAMYQSFENIFIPEYSEYFVREELVVPLEVYREKGNGDTQYRIILTSGRVGWISVDDSCVGDWQKVTQPL